jgi:hypothetical protein
MSMNLQAGVRGRVVALAAAVVLFEHLTLAEGLPGDSWQQHARSPAWAALAGCAILLMLLLRNVSAGCWLLAAGAAGNLLGWAQTGSVPDYMTVVVGERWVAFNLADVLIVIGAAMVIVALTARAREYGVRAPSGKR